MSAHGEARVRGILSVLGFEKAEYNHDGIEWKHPVTGTLIYEADLKQRLKTESDVVTMIHERAYIEGKKLVWETVKRALGVWP
jgi:hypothetical protein